MMRFLIRSDYLQNDNKERYQERCYKKRYDLSIVR